MRDVGLAGDRLAFGEIRDRIVAAGAERREQAGIDLGRLGLRGERQQDERRDERPARKERGWHVILPVRCREDERNRRRRPITPVQHRVSGAMLRRMHPEFAKRQ